MTGAEEGTRSLTDARSFLRELVAQPEVPTDLADTTATLGRTARGMMPSHRRLGFTAAQLVPAFLLGGLWYWDKRRRYFEDHPGELRRRRARRAVTREARRAKSAARRGDPKRFLHHALMGIREASAPVAPADPRALVREDVLQSLPPQLRRRSTVALVNELFSAANQWRFGDNPPETKALLSLASEVDRELNAMKEAL
jgi:hypothetical protein